jgi:hypothetical protein
VGGGGARCLFPSSRISTHAVGGVGGGEGAGARSEGGRERGSLRETERERGDRLQPPHDRSRAGRKAQKGERLTHAVGGVGGGEGAGARSEGGRERESLRDREGARGQTTASS